MLNEAFQTLKTNLELNPTFKGRIETHHNAVRSAIQNIDSSIRTKLIGSVSRQTRIQSRPNDPFDIDVLVVLGSFNRWLSEGGITADQAMQHTLDVVQRSERYASMNPQPDHPTITIPYQDDTNVELVPAYRDDVGSWPNGTPASPTGRGYWVPKRGSWELADYDHDADVVTRINQDNDGWLLPTIKMLKALRRRHFAQIGSFHFEILCVNSIPHILSALDAQGIPRSYPRIIGPFFSVASNLPINGVALPESNSPLVSLSDSTPEELINIWERIASFCSSIQGTERQQCQQWRELFGEEFPAV